MKAQTRDKLGTRVSRKLRAEGQIPVVVYGHGEAPESWSLPAHDIDMALSHGAHVLKVSVGGGEQQVLIKDIQFDSYGNEVLHMDLLRVNLDERVTVTVGIEPRGTPKGVEEDGGILDNTLTEIEVECLVTNIPETLHPLVTHLEIGDSLTAGDIELPEGVVLITDPDERILGVRPPIVEEDEDEEAAPEGEEGAEPEVIGRAKKDDEEGEGDKKGD